MKNDWLRIAFKTVLPVNVSKGYLEIYDMVSDKPLGKRLKHVFSQVAYSYKAQAFASINLRASIVELALVNFCLLAATSLQVQPSMLVADGAIMSALILRDIWSHRIFSSKTEMPTMSQYYLASAVDAAAAGVMLLFSQCLATWFSTSLALPGGAIGPFAVISLPLISVFRLVLRPLPDPQTPGAWRGLSAMEIYKSTRRLNVIWTMLYCGTILMNTSDIPNYYPDRLRGLVPITLFSIWSASQVNSLLRHIKIIRLFEDRVKAELARLMESLPQGLKPSDPHYWLMRTTEVLMFGVLSLSQAEVIWRWLSGTGGHLGTLILVTNTLSFAITLVTWRYIKHANRAAAAAMQKEINALG